MTDSVNPTGADDTGVLNQPLPPGVHPNDPAQDGGLADGNQPVDPDTGGPRFATKPAPWRTENEDALPVYQRAAHDWTSNTFLISKNNGGTIQVIGRQKGRIGVQLWVPSTATNGVRIAPTEGEVQANSGAILNVGDSAFLPTEGPVWVGLLPTKTTGTVYVTVFYNPAGGSLGGQ
jgi:hypothetical protein